ncbi:hypothetical protein [Butyrivibrio proteoclasticus]|nr:hypothetical protein [Butyrivibrio proteoclasticus]
MGDNNVMIDNKDIKKKKERKKVKVTIAYFDGKEKRKETREIYRYV